MSDCKLIYGVDVIAGLKQLADKSVHTCVTSPPYWGLRDYGVPGQIGLEKTPEKYVGNMVVIFREVRRVLRDDGTLWLNLGDSYCASPGQGGKDTQTIGLSKGKRIPRGGGRWGGGNKYAEGLKPKDLVGIPWLIAFAMRYDGWYLRSDIIWSKSNPMPESVTDRPTKAHEYIFLMSKSAKYYYDAESIKEPAIYFDDDRKGRANADHKSMPTLERNGIRPAVYKDAKSYDGKHSDKQRGHGRRHAGFNDRWDAMPKEQQCSAMRNKRSVWIVSTSPYKKAHFATFPPKLIEPCIKAGCPTGGTVLDPFSGSGTTGQVAICLGRKYIGIDLNEKYLAMAKERIGIFALETPPAV